MPGAKRRALKKILNPHSSSPSPPPNEHGPNEDLSAQGGPSLTLNNNDAGLDQPTSASTLGSASMLGYVPAPLGPSEMYPPGNGLGAGDSTDALIREMESRQGMIGTGRAAEMISPNQTGTSASGAGSSAIPIPEQGKSAANHELAPPPNSSSGSASRSPSKRFSLSSLGFSRHNHSNNNNNNDNADMPSSGDGNPDQPLLGPGGGTGEPVSRSSTKGSLRRSFDFGSRDSAGGAGGSGASTKSGETLRPTAEELAGVGKGSSRSHSNGSSRPVSAGMGSAPPIAYPSTSPSPHLAPTAPAPKRSSKQRFLDREARKKEAVLSAGPAAMSEEDVTKLEREKREEEEVMKRAEGELGVRLVEIDPDGHCMYSAISDQLHLLGLSDSRSYQTSRTAAATYLRAHAEDFQAFLPSVLGEDMAGATDDGVMTDEGYQEYCKRVESSGDWGGEIEIQALSRHYNIPIHVIQRGPPMIIAHAPDERGRSGPLTSAESLAEGKAVRISYHRRMYGLGEHYNSLHPDPDRLPVSNLAV